MMYMGGENKMDGVILKQLREERRLTQDEMANYMHVTKRAYAGWERGERDVSTETLCRLADYFSVTTDYLLGRLPMNVKVKHEKLLALAEGQHEVSVTIPDGLSQSELESRLEQLVQRLVRQELHRQSEE